MLCIVCADTISRTLRCPKSLYDSAGWSNFCGVQESYNVVRVEILHVCNMLSKLAFDVFILHVRACIYMPVPCLCLYADTWEEHVRASICTLVCREIGERAKRQSCMINTLKHKSFLPLSTRPPLLPPPPPPPPPSSSLLPSLPPILHPPSSSAIMQYGTCIDSPAVG